VQERLRRTISELEPQFAHRINGRWYYSTDLDSPPETLEQYRERVKYLYGSLRGVIFATRGVDYDGVVNNCPVINNHYL
jgi:hypothetical protein